MGKIFKIDFEELNFTGEPLPTEVAQKMLDYHIVPMHQVRMTLGRGVWASQKSGYRPKEWELKQGRSGNSQHTFEGKGAVDWTCSGDIKELLELIMEITDYSRVCYYPKENFIHCDHKDIGDKRQYFEYEGGKWKFIKHF